MYATCRHGHQHWGAAGAAGGLVVAPGESGPLVLLTLSSAAVHQGSTWSVPGGAIDPSDPDAHAAACREISEELSYDVGDLPVIGWHDFVCGGWTYSTVLFRTDAAVPLANDGWETDEVRWFEVAQVDRLAEESVLHPGFASSWPELRRLVLSGSQRVESAEC
jgi:8-oxo-dGTP diphosphatase